MYSVLIAEDELLVRMGIDSSVPWEQFGMRVVSETADGLSAWQAFERFHPDIIIVDIRMPRMDGIELLRRIRSRDADCAVIIVTNVEYDETICEAHAMNVIDVLLKASMKRDDIVGAILRARDALIRSHRVGNAEEVGDKRCWKHLLEEGTPAYFPGVFEPKCFILLQICPSLRLSFRLEESLKNLFEHRLNMQGVFIIVTFEMSAIALAQEVIDCNRIESSLMNLRRYVLDNFDEELRFIFHSGTLAPEELKQYTEQARRFLTRSDLFSNGMLLLDRNAGPMFNGLDDMIRALYICTLVAEDDGIFVCLLDRLRALPNAFMSGAEIGRAAADELFVEMDTPTVWRDMGDLMHKLSAAIYGKCNAFLHSVHPKILEAVEFMDTRMSDKPEPVQTFL